jgi:hypothetical protein
MSASFTLLTYNPEFSEEVEKLYKISQSSTIGSKYFSEVVYLSDTTPNNSWDAYLKLFDLISGSIWIGDVSWLKAALFDDAKSFVPSLVEFISELIGEDFPIITDEMIEKVENANFLAHPSYKTIEPSKVIDFLKKHKGEKTFTLSE